VEINARLAGDLIPYLGHLAGGPDLELAAAAVACGDVPDLVRGTPRVAAIRYYYPESDVTVAAVRIDETLLPPGVVRAAPLADPGQRVLLPPRGSAWESRLAQVVVVQDTEAMCMAALDAAAKAVVVTRGEVRGMTERSEVIVRQSPPGQGGSPRSGDPA
jgi:hypothetical protein